MSTLKDKLRQGIETSTPKRTSYRADNGRTVSLADAKAKRWAHKETGEPTKIYALRLAKREARRAGKPEPVRVWTPKNPGQTFGELESPYDLNRRSGQALIWAELALTPNVAISRTDLQANVNATYAERFVEYYKSKYNDGEFDTFTTAIVMNRAPFNAKIEALKQRVEVDTVAETVMLMTNVSTPRVPKKRGRKPGVKVEADADADTTVVAPVETPAEATA